MNTTLIVFIAIGLVLFFIGLMIENFFEKLIDKLFGLLGWETGSGLLVVVAIQDGDRLELDLTNMGDGKIKLAVIEGRDSNQKRLYPRPYLTEKDFTTPLDEKTALQQLSQITIKPGDSRELFLDSNELASLDCQSLAVLDISGKSWPVEGLDEILHTHQV